MIKIILFCLIVVGYIVLPRYLLFNDNNIKVSAGDVFVVDFYLDKDSSLFDTVMVVYSGDHIIVANDYSNYESPKFIRISKNYFNYCIIK